MRTCTFEGCDRKYRAKGYCIVHYNMLKRGKALHPIGKPGRPVDSSGAMRLCCVEGCNKKHLAKGYCKPHWRQHYAGKPIGEIGVPRKKTATICKVSECNKPSRALGFCEKHYCRWRTHGTIDLIPRRVISKKCGHRDKKSKVKCDVDNCDNFARVRGWCTKHYQRYQRHGDPLTCYVRPRKSEYISIDNILKQTGNYSKEDDAEVLRESFSEIYHRYDQENYA